MRLSNLWGFILVLVDRVPWALNNKILRNTNMPKGSPLLACLSVAQKKQRQKCRLRLDNVFFLGLVNGLGNVFWFEPVEHFSNLSVKGASTYEQVIGDYVVGWIKRGPSGIIGTNKPDAVESVNMFLEDLGTGKVLDPNDTSIQTVLEMVKSRKPNYVTFADWEKLDEIELKRGEETGRSRVKFTRIEDMLDALGKSEPLETAGD